MSGWVRKSCPMSSNFSTFFGLFRVYPSCFQIGIQTFKDWKSLNRFKMYIPLQQWQDMWYRYQTGEPLIAPRTNVPYWLTEQFFLVRWIPHGIVPYWLCMHIYLAWGGSTLYRTLKVHCCLHIGNLRGLVKKRASFRLVKGSSFPLEDECVRLLCSTTKYPIPQFPGLSKL